MIKVIIKDRFLGFRRYHNFDNFIFSGCPRSGKKSGKKYFFKVRELSGNFEISQGILKFKQKSGKSQGILKSINDKNFKNKG